MDANILIQKAEHDHIAGAAFEVIRELGHGLHAKPYEKALVPEFSRRHIPCEEQQRFPISYKTVQISENVPGLIAFQFVVMDTKVVEGITVHKRGLMLNSLRITGLQVGVILNFKRAKLEWERIVLSDHAR